MIWFFKRFFIYYGINLNKFIFWYLWWLKKRFFFLFKVIHFQVFIDFVFRILLINSISVCRSIYTCYGLMVWIRRLAWSLIRIFWFFVRKSVSIRNYSLLSVNLFFDWKIWVLITFHWLRLIIMLLDGRRLMFFFEIYNIHLHIF